MPNDLADKQSRNTPTPNDACISCTTRRDFLRVGAGSLGALSATLLAGPWRVLEALEPRASGAAVRYPIPAADGVSIDKKNEIILCRAGQEVYAFALSCPHENTALRTLPKNGGFQCPKHKSKYQPNGTFISGRATRNMDRLPITREGDALVVDPDRFFESDKDPARWAAALVKL
ncbi:MAG TPA: Rieske 2Fe-2S domain-containing protein [Gemmatimonas sp.]|uniref:QcrA and Rieske domain-containing protein n=1 Tax=Gemmatimonas sp. TaxID=1962908 RepID=UPI002ED9BA7A